MRTSLLYLHRADQYGLIVADNAINHYDTIKPMIEKAFNDENFEVPIGKGELVCRRKKLRDKLRKIKFSSYTPIC